MSIHYLCPTTPSELTNSFSSIPLFLMIDLAEPILSLSHVKTHAFLLCGFTLHSEPFAPQGSAYRIFVGWASVTKIIPSNNAAGDRQIR